MLGGNVIIQQKENFLETISKIKNSAEKMVRWKGIEFLLYQQYLSFFTNEIRKLNIFEKIKCYSEICNIKDSDASKILLNTILAEISELNDENLDLVENFIAEKQEETKEYGHSCYKQLAQDYIQELEGKTLWMPQKYELAEIEKRNQRHI